METTPETYYVAERGVGVQADGVPLPPRTDILDHSRGKLDWGRDTAGAAQLALALLTDHLTRRGSLHPEAYAARHHQNLKRLLVVHLNPRGWSLSSVDLDHCLQLIAPDLLEPEPPRPQAFRVHEGGGQGNTPQTEEPETEADREDEPGSTRLAG